MHLRNNLHVSFTPEEGPTTPDVVWYDQLQSSDAYSSAAVVNWRIYIGNGNGINSYSEINQSLIWRTPTIENVSGDLGVSSSPAVGNGYVFFGGDRIYCLYENNGTIKWTIEPGNLNWGDGSPTLANGKLFISGSDRKLYCIDQETGDIIWTFQTSSSGPHNWGLYSAPAVVNGFVYLPACDGFIYQINETQPTSIATFYHKFDMVYASYSSPVVVDDRLYVGSGYTEKLAQNRFFCLNATDLSLIWEFYPGWTTSFFSSAGVYNERVYVGSVDGNLYCLDYDGFDDGVNDGWTGESSTNIGDGDVIWYTSIGQTWSSPAITNERLYIGSKSNYLYCFNLNQTPGAEEYLWRYNMEGDVDSSPAVVNGKVYVGTHGNGGRIYCIGESTKPPPTNFTILREGWNLISIPWIQPNQSISSVLDSIDGKYDAVQWYSNDLDDLWKHHKVGKWIGNDLFELNETMAFWIHINQTGNTTLYFNGTPTSNRTISLNPGWNFVGFPSLTNHSRTNGLNNLVFGVDVDTIQWFNASTRTWQFMEVDDYFIPGRGYLIHSKVETSWEVPQ
jgi:outer membrane protein assembly factor BamB